MSSALLTAIALSLAGLIGAIVTGFTASAPAEMLRHATLSVFVTLLTLLSHSMMMFYMIGKGRAVREAVQEGGLSRSFVAAVSEARRPVFSRGTLAMALTMATAIIGGGVDTRVIAPWIHGVLGVASLAANLAALRAEIQALTSSARVVDEVNRLLGA